MVNPDWLPTIFISLTGLSILIYAMLDGYDLGVGMLLPRNNEQHRSQMIASIGPFWDANETWLVLAIGLLLIAFPSAYSLVLKELYISATLMLSGLILRGVAFDFRAKVGTPYLKNLWDNIFFFGSWLTALSQGYMLGRYVVGFESTSGTLLFAIISAFGVAAAYAYIGGAWLIMKSEGELQKRAAYWTRRAGWLMALGVSLVSIVNLWINPDVLSKWIGSIYGLLLLPVPLVCLGIFWISDLVLQQIPLKNDRGCWIPFCNAASLFVLCFFGLAFSFYPYIVPTQLTIWESASAPESLQFLLWGTAFVIPTIILYTLISYRVFWGKTQDLGYY